MSDRGNQPRIPLPEKTIDIGRGLAALWVFAFHLNHLLVSPALLHRWAIMGYLGVPAFFIISGYCIYGSALGTIRRQQPSGAFLYRRMRRILPPFWLSIGVALVVPFILAGVNALRTGVFIAPPEPWLRWGYGEWISLFTLTRGFLFKGHPYMAYEAVNMVYWSLAIEVQFYIVVACAIWARRAFNYVLIAVTVCSCAMVVLIPSVRTSGIFLGYWPMFAMGIVFHHLLRNGFSPLRFCSPRVCAVVAGVLVLLVPAVWLQDSKGQFVFALYFAVLLWWATGVEPLIAGKSGYGMRFLLLMGGMSYSIYLLHAKVSQLAPFLLGGMPANPLRALCTVLLMLPIIYLFYRFCEIPFISTSTRRVVTPISIMTAPADTPVSVASSDR